jgi:hypothetical protein
MKKIVYLIISLAFITVSCTEEFEFDFDSNAQILAVDGVLTDQDVDHYIRLTKSKNTLVNADFSGTSNSATQFEAIKDAIITISDDVGNTEVLSYIGIREDDYTNTEGYYKIENIRGIVGRTYTLKIELSGKLYQSVSILKAVPEIEQVTFKSKYLELKEETVTIPLLHFTEPQNTSDYYLLHYRVDGWGGSDRNWEYSIISDKYLTEQVNGLEIDDGQSASGHDFYREIPLGAEVEVFIESLTKDAYEFYKGIIDQFDSDGGAFSQTPASPPGNISNGALGLFRCSAVNSKSVIKN